MTRLTDSERETLNAAEKILVKALTEKNEVLMLSLHHGWDTMSATYFSPLNNQHGSMWNRDDPSLAGKVQMALDIRAREAAEPDKYVSERVAALKAELAKLGQPA